MTERRVCRRCAAAALVRDDGSLLAQSVSCTAAWLVVGYAFRGELLCPTCLLDALRTGDGEPFDGWALADGVQMTVEDNLSELALSFGVDRYDERTFDSDDFPKVLFSSDADDDASSRCGFVLTS
jgi:hypothetical protein